MASKPNVDETADWGFEWPPKKKIAAGGMGEPEKSTVTPTSDELQPGVPENPLLEFNSRAHSVRPAPQVRRAPKQPSTDVQQNAETTADPAEDLSGLDPDFWGPIAKEEDQAKRAWIVPTAILVLTLIAVVEGVFLLRGGTEQSADSSTTTAAASPVVSEPRTPPSTTGALGSTGTVSAPSRVSGSTKPASGRLIIGSDPPGAELTIDGRPYGVTPMTLENLSIGEHQVLLKRGTAEVRRTVRVEPGRTASVVVPLLPSGGPQGWVNITAPVDVQVLERGVLLGTSRGPRIMLRPGAHVLEFVNTSMGYREQQWVRVHSGRGTDMTATLPEGILNINATPWADVSVDGKSVGQTPIGNLKIVAGSHHIVFRHPDLGEKTLTTVVKAGEATRVSADLTVQK